MDATAIFLSEMGISDLPDVFKGEQLKKETILFRTCRERFVRFTFK